MRSALVIDNVGILRGLVSPPVSSTAGKRHLVCVAIPQRFLRHPKPLPWAQSIVSCVLATSDSSLAMFVGPVTSVRTAPPRVPGRSLAVDQVIVLVPIKLAVVIKLLTADCLRHDQHHIHELPQAFLGEGDCHPGRPSLPGSNRFLCRVRLMSFGTTYTSLSDNNAVLIPE